jgi:hypothetical protein
LEANAAAAEDAAESLSVMTDALTQAGVAEEIVKAAGDQLALQLGETTQLALVQEDALVLLAEAFKLGIIGVEEYGAAALEVRAVTEDSIAGYMAVAGAVNTATGSYYDLSASAGPVVDAMDRAAQAAVDAAALAEEMGERQREAWETFAQSVEGAVGQALEAYRSGNAEMLAEQQAALAELLWNQTDTMLSLGQITEDQAMAMKVAISTEFGVMVDETDLATNRILALYGDWAAGGETTAEEIIAFMLDIGQETDEMAAEQEAALRESMTAWQNYQDSVTRSSDQIIAEQEAIAAGNTWLGGMVVEETGRMSEAVEDTARTWDVEADGMVQSLGAAASGIGQQADEIVTHLGRIETGLYRLPSERVIRLRMEHNLPPGFDEFGSPDFVWTHALERLVKYADSHVIPLQFDTQGIDGGSVQVVGALAGRDGGSGVTYDQRRYSENHSAVTINGAGLGSVLLSSARQV